MKRFFISALCFVLLTLQLAPCFALATEIQTETNPDGSYFIISDEELLPDMSDSDIETIPGNSIMQESSNMNSLV